MTRTFMALDLNGPTRHALANAQQRLEGAGARVRWTAPENLHVTVKFLGDVLDEDLPRVCEAASEIAELTEAFEFTVDRIVSAPPHGHMRMVWAKIGDPTGRMTEMAAMLNDACAAMGFKHETRDFRPHLTLGRVKGGRGVDALRRIIVDGEWAPFEAQYAEELVVYSSQLTREGPIYTPLAHAPLAEEE